MWRTTTLFLLVAILGGTMTWSALADDSGEPTTGGDADAPVESAAPADQSKPAQSSEDVMDDLLERSRPKVEPTQRPARSTPRNRTGATVNVDERVVGVAPGGEQPTLRREGDFIINRRGRVIRSGEQAQPMFVFEAENETAGETPMYLLPSQLLESVENLIEQRGDTVVFNVSGQITLYRGANYLLLTMMKPVVDTENLR